MASSGAREFFCPFCGDRPAEGECPRHPGALVPAGGGDDDLSGNVLVGTYLLRRRIDGGAFGVVYEGWDISLHKRHALKLLHARHQHDPHLLERFRREGRALDAVRNPHVVGMGVLLQDQCHGWFLVMDFVEGTPLSQASPFPMRSVVAIGRQIANALRAVHEKGIVHRDVKPSNVAVALARDGTLHAKLLDFGVVRLTEAFQPALTRQTQEGRATGTVQYMSPEQCRGKALDGRADLYSLGVVLYELAAGRHPFEVEEEAASADLAFMLKHVQETPVPPSSLSPERGIPPALDEIVMQLLAKSPGDRFPSAAELEAALAGVSLEDAPPGAATTDSGDILRDPADAPMTSTSPGTTPWKPAGQPRFRRRRTGLLLAGAGAVLVLFLAALALAFGWWRGPEPRAGVPGLALEPATPVVGPTESPPKDAPAPAEPRDDSDAVALPAPPPAEEPPVRPDPSRGAKRHTDQREAEPDPVAPGFRRTSEEWAPPAGATTRAHPHGLALHVEPPGGEQRAEASGTPRPGEGARNPVRTGKRPAPPSKGSGEAPEERASGPVKEPPEGSEAGPSATKPATPGTSVTDELEGLQKSMEDELRKRRP